MNNDIVSRIREIMDYKSLNSLTLSNELGYKSSEKISRLFREGNAKPSYDIIYDISIKLDINVDWLITGRGDRLQKKAQPVEINLLSNSGQSIMYNMYSELLNLYKLKEEECNNLHLKIGHLEERLIHLGNHIAQSKIGEVVTENFTYVQSDDYGETSPKKKKSTPRKYSGKGM